MFIIFPSTIYMDPQCQKKGSFTLPVMLDTGASCCLSSSAPGASAERLILPSLAASTSLGKLTSFRRPSRHMGFRRPLGKKGSCIPPAEIKTKMVVESPGKISNDIIPDQWREKMHNSSFLYGTICMFHHVFDLTFSAAVPRLHSLLHDADPEPRTCRCLCAF